MKITILSSEKHPIIPHIESWKSQLLKNNIFVDIETNSSKVKGGDILFLLSHHDIVKKNVRSKFCFCFVIHASDLPKGRGWSPHIWGIIEGKNTIKVSLIEAADKVDTGDIYFQETVKFEGHELYDEINSKIFASEFSLMSKAIDNFPNYNPRKQRQDVGDYYKKRTPSDSELFTNKTIGEQFNLLRVCDPDRYPAFFSYRGAKYKLMIKKLTDKIDD